MFALTHALSLSLSLSPLSLCVLPTPHPTTHPTTCTHARTLPHDPVPWQPNTLNYTRADGTVLYHTPIDPSTADRVQPPASASAPAAAAAAAAAPVTALLGEGNASSSSSSSSSWLAHSNDSTLSLPSSSSADRYAYEDYPWIQKWGAGACLRARMSVLFLRALSCVRVHMCVIEIAP
jgi:hypothetical protein